MAPRTSQHASRTSCGIGVYPLGEPSAVAGFFKNLCLRFCDLHLSSPAIRFKTFSRHFLSQSVILFSWTWTGTQSSSVSSKLFCKIVWNLMPQFLNLSSFLFSWLAIFFSGGVPGNQFFSDLNSHFEFWFWSMLTFSEIKKNDTKKL